MAIKRKPITHKSFLKDVFAHRKATDKLGDAYADKFCKIKTGKVIDLPEGTKEGFSKFTIEKIVPEIKQERTGQYSIGFVFYGEFSGLGRYEKGPLRIKSNDNEGVKKS